jgi:ubiquinone/menaquinone biosynthesis C-methylase UbiE
MDQTHYSYRVYADPEVARGFDRERFGGTIGEYLKQTQEQTVFSVLPDVRDWKVLDVGAGTGRLTIPFLEKGAEVTACDASAQMLQVLQEKMKSERLSVLVADAHRLDFADRFFDCAISFRMLMHVLDWKTAVSELCRVSKDWVIFDLPPRHGFLLFAPIVHSIRGVFSSKVQAYRTFPLQAVRNVLRNNGFEVVTVDPGFFLPIAIHRLFSSRSFTVSSEKLFASLGLTRVTGSPFTFFARRKTG